MSDRIMISGVHGFGYHGVFEEEKRKGQDFTADVVMHISTRAAAVSDDLADSVDYGTAAELVHGVLVGDPVDLIETLAERIASQLLALDGVERVEVTVHKPSAPIAVPFGDVSVSISRP